MSAVRITPFALPLHRPLSVCGHDVAAWRGVLAERRDARRAGIGEGATPDVALESAALDLTAQRRGVRIADLLGGPRRRGVPVNALLDAADPTACGAQAAAFVARGFRTLKLKLDAADPDANRGRVAAVRVAVGPAVAVRADANGAWSAREAITALRPLLAYGLEYVEEPVAGVAALAEVRQALPIAIAADESARDAAAVETIAARRAADVIVIKPTLVGVRRAMEIAVAAHRHGLAVVITSALDSSIGIAAALHVACAIEAEPRACGLATAELLECDLGRPRLIARGGWLALPDGPGLGVTLDEEALRGARTGRPGGRRFVGALFATSAPPRPRAATKRRPPGVRCGS